MEKTDSGGESGGQRKLYLPHGSNNLNGNVEYSPVYYTRYQCRDCQQVLKLKAFSRSQDANQQSFHAEQVCMATGHSRSLVFVMF